MRIILFETVTGRYVHELEVSAWSYDTGVLARDKVSLTIPAYTPTSRVADLYMLIVPYKTSIILLDDDTVGQLGVPAAGVVTSISPALDPDGLDRLTIEVTGIETVLDSRHIRRYPGWPLLNSKNQATSVYDVKLTGLEYGTIIKRLVQEALKWGALPISFEDDRTGSRERTYLALDGKPVAEALDEIADTQLGVEYDFLPSWDPRTDTASWQLVTGTDQTREIVYSDTCVLPIGGAGTVVKNFSRTITGTALYSGAIMTGGKTDDTVLAATATNGGLIRFGVPYMEVWDSSHATVTQQTTLQGYASGVIAGSGFTDVWDCAVRYERASFLRHGDWVTFDVSGADSLPDGQYRRRVLAVGRKSSSPEWVDVKLMGEVNGALYS